MAFLETEFCPSFALCDARVDVLFYDGGSNSACCLDTLAIVVEAIGYYCLGAVFVRSYGLWGEGGGVIEFFVVSPVRAAGKLISIPARFELDGESTLLSLTYLLDVSKSQNSLHIESLVSLEICASRI